jgi:O-antigen/teichoic acid export membrane protein
VHDDDTPATGTHPPSQPVQSQASTLGKRALSGTAISLGGQLVSQVLRLGSNLVLTHLLAPDAFGLMAIVLAVTTGLQLISDVGIWQAIVRSPRGEERAFQDTAWTFTALRGVVLFAIGCASAYPAAQFYEREELLWLLPLCSAQALIMGLESTKLALAARRLIIGRMVGIDLVAQAAALAIALPVGFATHSVFALVCATMTSVVVRTVLSHVALPGGRNRFFFERAAAAEIWSFGGWIFVSTILYFIGTRWDVFALGKLEGMELVGVFGLATMITQVPVQLSEKVTGFVLMPALAERFRENPKGLADDVRRARVILFPAGAVLFLGAALTAPAFFDFLYRDVYESAGWMTQLVVLTGWCALLQDASSRALLALGNTKGIAAANFVRVLATVAFTYAGFTLGGAAGVGGSVGSETTAVIGFLVGSALGSFVGALALGVVLGRAGVRVIAIDVVATLLFVAIAALGCIAPYYVAPLIDARVSLVTLAFVPLLLGPLAAFVAVRTRRALRS